MGEVFRPEDVTQRRKEPISDLKPVPIPQRSTPTSLETVLQELKVLKDEITRIKNALRAHGIAVE